MKLSYNNYPILEKLHNGSLGKLFILEIDKDNFIKYLSDSFIKTWKYYAPRFSQEINYVSEPFEKAVAKSADSLLKLHEDNLSENFDDIDISGTYILGDEVYMIDYHAKKDKNHVDVVFYVFHKKGYPLCYMVHGPENYVIWMSQHAKLENNKELIERAAYSLFTTIVSINMFKKYAKVEEKHLEPISRQLGIGCKYINDTKLKVTHLDCKWFTTLIKSDSFNVRGHFRLQPKKVNGKWTRDLIWINEFEKKGYKAAARKLSFEQ